MARALRGVVASLSLCIVWASSSLAQMSAPKPIDPEVLTAINEQVWIPFCESLANNDAETFLSLHTKDMVRVSIRRNDVKSGTAFFEHTKQQMDMMKQAQYKAVLTLRFTSRSHGDDAAFEAGVYQIESPGGGQKYYGQFRVLLRKVDGQWKVALDADEPSDAAAFEAARPLEDVDWK